MVPEFQEPPVDVWGEAPLFVHSTDSPTPIVMVAGTKSKSTSLTPKVAADAGPPTASVRSMASPIRATTDRIFTMDVPPSGRTIGRDCGPRPAKNPNRRVRGIPGALPPSLAGLGEAAG